MKREELRPEMLVTAISKTYKNQTNDYEMFLRRTEALRPGKVLSVHSDYVDIGYGKLTMCFRPEDLIPYSENSEFYAEWKHKLKKNVT